MEDPLIDGVAGQFRETAANLQRMSEDADLQRALVGVAAACVGALRQGRKILLDRKSVV